MVPLIDQLLKAALRARVTHGEEGEPATGLRGQGSAARCACASTRACSCTEAYVLEAAIYILARRESRLAISAGKLHVSPAMPMAEYVARAEHCCPCEKRRDPRQLSVAETKHVCTLCTVVYAVRSGLSKARCTRVSSRPVCLGSARLGFEPSVAYITWKGRSSMSCVRAWKANCRHSGKPRAPAWAQCGTAVV